MSRKGGYQIVDFKNISLTADGKTTVAGVYEAIKVNYNKRLVVSGIIIGSTEYDDVTVDTVVVGTDFVFRAYGYKFVVASNDGVTVSSALVENIPASVEATAPTTAEFNALLKALKDAGIMQPDGE